MFETFTIEETNLMCIFDTSTKSKLIAELNAAIDGFEEPELAQIAEGVINKLILMSDDEYNALELYPAYEEDDVEEE